MAAWLPVFHGAIQVATAFAPVDWHIHELFFGYLSAVVTGFLFTAVPNWTSRMPIQGRPLMFLLALWLSGRLAVAFSAHVGWAVAMVVDVAFLAMISLVIGREIAAGKNWRNLKVLLPIGVLVAANAGFHLEAHFSGVSDISRRVALAAVITLIMLIGGRIIPSFTRNWLARENPGRLPASFNGFDVVSIVTTVGAFLIWIVSPESPFVGPGMAIAAVLQILRLSRWAGDRTLANPLIAVLHISYLFIPVGLAFLASAQFWPSVVPQATGVHALGAGAAGAMTLSVMIRATLGHTGRPVTAGIATNVIFGGVVVSATARIWAALSDQAVDLLLDVSALAWFIAFAGFVLVFGPTFFRSRVQDMHS